MYFFCDKRPFEQEKGTFKLSFRAITYCDKTIGIIIKMLNILLNIYLTGTVKITVNCPMNYNSVGYERLRPTTTKGLHSFNFFIF